MGRKKRPASAIRRLHRSIGVFAAIFVLFMVLSGIVINHSNGLGLDRQQVSQPLLLDWYGLGGPDAIRSFTAGNDWLSFAGSQLFLNDKYIATVAAGVGAVSNGNLIIAAGSDELLLLDLDGTLIERLPWDPISTKPIESVGLYENDTVIVKSAGQLWLADADFLNWDRLDETMTAPQWSEPSTAPETLQQEIASAYRGDGLSLERVLLDLHSGRIFGPVGVFVYDLLAICLGFLSISGLVLWFRSRRNGKRKGK
jgi:hypothetical protein